VLNGALCGCLAPESADLKRRWFYGRVEGAVEYRYGVAKGSRLLDDLAATEHGIESIEARPPKPTKVSSAPANTEPRTEHDISRAISALQTIPNSGEQRLPYDRWRDLAMALHAATGGHPRALDALIEWTADGQDEKTTAIWNGLRVDGGIGPGTLFKAAHDAGWNDPARVPSAEGLEAIDEPLDVGAEMIEGAAAREAGAAIEKAKTRFKSEPGGLCAAPRNRVVDQARPAPHGARRDLRRAGLWQVLLRAGHGRDRRSRERVARSQGPQGSGDVHRRGGLGRICIAWQGLPAGARADRDRPTGDRRGAELLHGHGRRKAYR
jgi:hypothetical protein